MSKKQALRDLVAQRLEAAAVEIFVLIEHAFVEYEEEIVRLKCAKQQKNVQQKQDVQTPFGHPEGIPKHMEEEQTLATTLEYTFTTPTLKSEDDIDKSTFLQQQPAKEMRHNTTEQLYGVEPGCSLELPQNNNEKTDCYSDTDDSVEWENSAQKSTQNITPDLIQNKDSQKVNPNGKSKKRTKRQQGLTESGVAIKKERDLLTFSQSGAVETPYSYSVSNNQLPTQTHSSNKPVNCPECGVRLHRQHSLDRHISAVHRREKPFRCPVCQKGFARKTDCVIHMRVHTGERPYSCPVCDKTFNVKNSLRRHLRLHKEQAAVQGN
ncbi:hypothetical protein NQD34_000748 [Periophthalmus magnuspinnatus]|uniref:zinc finger protein 425-like n=1 Tax=Periophthalmus magnuspinnatus TaxID=409849 RepID=UPI0022C9D03B|nr:zinc finger protein 425-like [Periophthalmus magnuspinnatus]KAJ0033641.1 hypothetical protein NQD34_000748 [Periophthalmus magnuspinnatus]